MLKYFQYLSLISFILILSGCSSFKSSEENEIRLRNIRAQLEQANYCEQDADCAILPTHCAIGFQFLVHKSQVEKLKQITQQYVDEFKPEKAMCSIDPSTFSCVQNTCRFEREVAEEEGGKTLLQFFDFLRTAQFEKAVSLFAPEEWEPLAVFTEEGKREDKTLVLKNYCEATGTCLEAKIVSFSGRGEGVYSFGVEFYEEDGNRFVLGPCCGASEAEMPSQMEFFYEVRKIDGHYKVMTPPLYRP